MSKRPEEKRACEPWRVVGTSRNDSYRVFSIRTDRAVSPRTGVDHDFYILESTPWVNVIALTDDGRIVLVRQYRHGTREVTLEIPGGLVENNDTPLQAARKELREETGFEATQWVDLGYVRPNPAMQSNACHTFVATGAFHVGELDLDDKEDIVVEIRPLSEIPEIIKRGEINHGLVLAAFYRFYMEYLPSLASPEGKP